MPKKSIWGAGILVALILIAGFLYLYFLGPSEKQIAEDEWITHYYRNRQPDRLVPVLESVLSQSKLISNPAYFGPLAHFFATVIQENKNKIGELKTLENRYSGKGREAIRKIITLSENYRPSELNSPKDLEFLLSEFKATGREPIIEKIIKVIDHEGISTRMQLIDAAKNFLIMKAPQHVEIYDILQQKSISLSGWAKGQVEEVLNKIRISFEEPANRHIHRGVNYANLGKYDDALKEYRKALRYFPDYSAVYVNMAVLYERIGNLEKAFSATKKAVEIDPSDPITNYNLGRHYFRLKRYDEAIKCYTKALEYHPDKPHYIHALARSYQEKGDRENAVIYFRKYLEVLPTGEHAPLVRQYLVSVGKGVEEDIKDIVVMLQKKKYDSLEKHFATLLREKNRDKDGYSLLKSDYWKLCFHRDAEYAFETWINYFKDWLKNNPSSHFANACMGMFYIRYAWHARGTGWGSTVTQEGSRLFKERLLTAKDYLEKAYALDRSDPIVPANLIDVARGLGAAYDEMEKQFQRAIKADSTEYDAYYRKLIYIMPKWYGSEYQMFSFAREVAKNAPSNSLIPLVLAHAHWEMYYRSNIKASYFKNREVWNEVKDVYQTLCKRFPDSNRVHNWFAVAAYLAGDYEIARSELKAIEGVRP
jgi:tetratricopeptide (TPR) repeat protein